MKKTLHLLAFAALAAAVAFPLPVSAERGEDTTLSEDLDRNDPILEPVGSQPTVRDEDARRAEDELDAYATGAKAEIKDLAERAKQLKKQAGDLNDAQKSALDDFHSAKDAAVDRVDEVEDADIETGPEARGRAEAAMAALRSSFERLQQALS